MKKGSLQKIHKQSKKNIVYKTNKTKVKNLVKKIILPTLKVGAEWLCLQHLHERNRNKKLCLQNLKLLHHFWLSNLMFYPTCCLRLCSCVLVTCGPEGGVPLPPSSRPSGRKISCLPHCTGRGAEAGAGAGLEDHPIPQSRP